MLPIKYVIVSKEFYMCNFNVIIWTVCQNGITALMVACRNGCTALANKLIAGGANLNLKSNVSNM